MISSHRNLTAGQLRMLGAEPPYLSDQGAREQILKILWGRVKLATLGFVMGAASLSWAFGRVLAPVLGFSVLAATSFLIPGAILGVMLAEWLRRRGTASLFRNEMVRLYPNHCWLCGYAIDEQPAAGRKCPECGFENPAASQ